jgi:hypothetical protein
LLCQKFRPEKIKLLTYVLSDCKIENNTRMRSKLENEVAMAYRKTLLWKLLKGIVKKQKKILIENIRIYE